MAGENHGQETNTSSRQSLSVEFIARRVEGRKNRDGGREARDGAKACLPFQKSNRKERLGVSGACLLKETLHLYAVRDLLAMHRGMMHYARFPGCAWKLTLRMGYYCSNPSLWF